LLDAISIGIKFEMTPYKLAFIIERYFEFGGLQRNMRQFALACATQGHDVTVFTGRWDGPDEPTLNVQTVDWNMPSNHGTIRKMEAFVRNLRQTGNFDCITGFNRVGGLDIYYGGDVCLKAKLQQQHRMWLQFLPRYRTYLQFEAAVFGPGSNTEIMLISPAEKENFQRIYNTASDRICLLPPGIDRKRLTAHPLTGEQRDQFRQSFGLRKNDLMVLTVGSSFHTKGIDRAIHAVSGLTPELKNRCRYIVVGLGKDKKFKAIAQKEGVGDHVCFTGGRHDIANFYHAADILLHPARTENTGNTLLEAMVAGLPVIATENCGYAYYIREADAGAVCPVPFDQAQLNQILNDILIDEQHRIQCGNNGRTYCETADIYSRIERGTQIILNRAENNRGNR